MVRRTIVFLVVGFALGSIAFGLYKEYTKPSPLDICKRECRFELNTTVRVGNTTNVYSCSCDNL